MRKLKLFIILIISLLIPLTTYASTNTCTRDKNNLNIPNKIDYNSNMDDNILSTPCVNATEKVYDFAELLTQEEENMLYEEITEFINNKSLDLAVVTINNNPKGSVEKYADDFFDYNDFSMDGLVFLIDMSTREFYISTAGKAMLYYDDYRIERLLDAAFTNMHNENYQEAIISFINEAKYYYDDGIVNTQYTITKDGKIVRKTPWIIFIIISLIPTIIITLQLALRNKKVSLATNADNYLGTNKINITKSEDKLIDSHTSSIYIPPVESSSNGGGHSSGGSFHSGSSGMSHGGGGRHF